MCGYRYPDRVKTIDVIRLENYRSLLDEFVAGYKAKHKRDPKGKEIAQAFGITAVYVSQLKTGVRSNIEETAARAIEQHREREVGWMDNDRALWPFQTITTERFARLPDRYQGMAEQEVRRIIEEWESKGGGLGGSGPSPGDGPKVANG